MWETDPRMLKILSEPVGKPIDWSVFTLAELRHIGHEVSGSMPDLPDPPKAEVSL